MFPALASIFYQRLRNMFDEHRLLDKRWVTQFCTSRDFEFSEHRATKIADSVISSMMNTGRTSEMLPPASATPHSQRLLEVTMDFEQEFMDSNAISGIIGDYQEITDYFSAEQEA
jgi:hypothetical protein